MVKYGDSTLKVYKEIKQVMRSIEKDTMREIMKRASDGCPYQVVHYSYKLEACSIIKNAISDNKEWHFNYNNLFKLTQRSVLERCVNEIASKMRLSRGFKLGCEDNYGSAINDAFEACMRTVFEIEKNKEPKLLHVRDTNLVVSKSTHCAVKTNNARVKKLLGYNILKVKVRENNVYDARLSSEGMLYAIDTPENREIIAKYYGEVLGEWDI